MAGESAPASVFATSVVSDHRPVALSAESECATWATHHAVGGLTIAETPRSDPAGLARLLLALWPLLDDGAIEVRWLASEGQVSCAILLRTSGDDDQVARGECVKRLEAARELAASLMHGWTLTPLDDASLGLLIDPFEFVDAGDLIRNEVDVALADGGEADIPLLLSIDPSEIGLLVTTLARSPYPTVVSLAAAPVELDEAERAVLHAELATLERAVVDSSIAGANDAPRGDAANTPASRLSVAAHILQRRVIATERVGFLRVSLASAGPISLALLTSAQEALSATPVALDWSPATETAEREVFSANLRTVGFTPWGVQVAEQPGHESVNDCYLASLEEIVSELVVPLADGFLPLAHRMLDPVPRPVPKSVPHDGRVVGVSLYDPTRRVALAEEDRTRHTYVVGQTGTGKSTLLLNLALQDIEAGLGTCVIDPHGDLVDAILERFPKERADDLVLFDPTHSDRVVGLNPLEATTPAEKDFVIQQLIGMLYRIYDPEHSGIIGPRFEHMVRNGALVVMAQPDGGTLMDLPRVFTDNAFMAQCLAHVDDPVVRSFWIHEQGRTSDFHQSEVLGWFTSKFGAFSTNAAMRGILSQRESGFELAEIMDSGKVLLVKLPRGVLGEINAMWLGMILISKIQMAALGRADRPPAERRLFSLYVDEFQNFAYTDFDALIAEARKYGLALTLAHQHVAQLTPVIRSAVIGNVATWMLFRMGLADAELLEDDVDGFSARDLARTANRRCVVRTSVEGNPAPPFDIATLSPDTREPNPELAEALAKLAMLKYGRSAELVELEFRARWRDGAPPKIEPTEESREDVGVTSAAADASDLGSDAGAAVGTPDTAAGEPATGEAGAGAAGAAADGVDQALDDASSSDTMSPAAPEDIPRLLAKWDYACDARDTGLVSSAGRKLAGAYAAAGRDDEALSVLEAALAIVGPAEEELSTRRTLVRAIVASAQATHPRRAMLALAKVLFSGGSSDDAWVFIHGQMGKMSEVADRQALMDGWNRIEELNEADTRPTWDELDADPVFG